MNILTKRRNVYGEEKVAEYFDRLNETYDEQIYGYMMQKRMNIIRDEIIGTHVLDIGCNCGKLMSGYLSGQKAVGVDISLETLKTANEILKAEFVQASAAKLPFQNGIFESIVCSETLYYLEKPENLIREAWCLLKPGGKLIVVFSNQLYCGLGRIFKFFGCGIEDIITETFYPDEVIDFLRKENYQNIHHKGHAVVPITGMEFFDYFFPKTLGFVHVVTGVKC